MNSAMGQINFDLVEDFKGEAVILLAFDTNGLSLIRNTLIQAKEDDAHTAKLTYSDNSLYVSLTEQKTEFSLYNKMVSWKLSWTRHTEVLEKLNTLYDSPEPCHHYVDIDGPVNTLVLSKDEYC